jgi:hypothetical protein
MADDYGDHVGYPREQRLADAKLIAAAPELLSALIELKDLMQGVIDEEYKPDSFTTKVAEIIIKAATE